MAEPTQSTMMDVRPIMAAELKARAAQLASILGIKSGTYGDKDAEAYQIMGHLAAMPTVKDFGRRRQYGNEILMNAARSFPPSSAEGGLFHSEVERLVAEMQEFPAWFSTLTSSNDDLVENYVTLTRVLDAMKWLGWGGLGTASGKVARGALTEMDKALAKRAGARAVAGGAVRGAGSGAAKLVTGGLATRTGIFVWAVGEFAYQALLPQQAQLAQEITRRYQEGRLSAQLYQRAFGSETPPPTRYFFKV